MIVIHRVGGLEMSSRDLFNIFDVIHRVGGLEIWLMPKNNL